MSAFRRRTVFAAPIILTVAACSGGKTPEEPAPKRYPGATWHVSQRGGPDDCMAGETDLGCPKGVRCNPPPPQTIKCPTFPEGREWVRVVKRPSGECAILPDGCFDDTCVGAATDCPLPFGQQLPPKEAGSNTEPAKPEQAPAP
jgi:hypothetical protein